MDESPVQLEQRGRIVVLRFDGGRERVVREALPRFAACETRPRRAGPLHWRAQTLVGLRADHADLFAIVHERHAGHREEEKRRDTRPRHVAAELRASARLVVIAQEGRPAIGGDVSLKTKHRRQKSLGRSLTYRGDDAVGHFERKVRVELLGIVAEQNVVAVRHLPDRERVRLHRVNVRFIIVEHCMRPGGVPHPAILLDEVWDRIEPESIDSHVLQPKSRDFFRLRNDGWVRVVQVRHAAREQAVVVLVAHRRVVPDLAAPVFLLALGR